MGSLSIARDVEAFTTAEDCRLGLPVSVTEMKSARERSVGASTPSVCSATPRSEVSHQHTSVRRSSLPERTAAFLALALAASALLHPALCADAPAGRAARTPPWHNPCGRTTILPRLRQRHQQRHQQQQHQRQQRQQQQQDTTASAAANVGLNASDISARSWSLRNVREKLHIARSHLREEWKTINSLYKDVTQVEDYRAHYDWLPKYQLKWYRKEVACLDRNSQASIVLPVLHAALQNFSATLQDLQKSRPLNRYDVLFERKRNQLMIRMGNQVKGILCEVETSLTERALQRPNPLASADLSKEVTHLQKNPDFTSLLVQDWSVIAAYGDALLDWSTVLRQLGYAPKLPRGEAPTIHQCKGGAMKRKWRTKPNKGNKTKEKRKEKGKTREGKAQRKPRLRPGKRIRENRHRKRHQRPRLQGTLTS